MSRRKLRDADEARRFLAEAAASGLTRPEWALANGIDGRSLNAWHQNLERARHRDAKRAPRLVELVPAEPVVTEPIRYVVHCGELAVEVDHRFDDDVLRRLLGVMASC